VAVCGSKREQVEACLRIIINKLLFNLYNTLTNFKALHAHLAYLFLNTPFNELDSKAVISIIAAQLFLSAHHPYNLDPITRKSKKDKNEGNALAIPDTQMFDLFQVQAQ
jgi:hypothetical protein